MKDKLLPLRLVCVLGFLKAVSNMAVVYSPVLWQVGRWYPAYYVVLATGSVVALGGLWSLRRWGFWAYAAYAAVSQAVPLLMHRWDSAILILPALTLFTAAFYFRRMK